MMKIIKTLFSNSPSIKGFRISKTLIGEVLLMSIQNIKNCSSRTDGMIIKLFKEKAGAKNYKYLGNIRSKLL